MTIMTFKQACAATGKSRATIYRYIEKGKLSAKKDANGHNCFDPAELERAFGSLKLPDTGETPEAPPKNTPKKQADTPSDVVRLEAEIAALKAENTKITAELETEKDERRKATDSERKLSEGLLQLRLEDHTDKRSRGFLSRLFGGG